MPRVASCPARETIFPRGQCLRRPARATGEALPRSLNSLQMDPERHVLFPLTVLNRSNGIDTLSAANMQVRIRFFSDVLASGRPKREPPTDRD